MYADQVDRRRYIYIYIYDVNNTFFTVVFRSTSPGEDRGLFITCPIRPRLPRLRRASVLHHSVVALHNGLLRDNLIRSAGTPRCAPARSRRNEYLNVTINYSTERIYYIQAIQ